MTVQVAVREEAEAEAEEAEDIAVQDPAPGNIVIHSVANLNALYNFIQGIFFFEGENKFTVLIILF